MSDSANKKKDLARWYVYIVRCADNTLYTGVSTNVKERVATHNRGRGAKYTRARLPVELVYEESAIDRSVAQKREHAIKQLTVGQKKNLIAAGHC